MENASKALAIAGGILISIMIIAVLIYMMQGMGEYKQAQVNEEYIKELTEFNKEYESFEKTLMRGTDVVTVVNKANDYNLKHAYDGDGNEILSKEDRITTKIKIKTGEIKNSTGETIMVNKEYTIGNYNKTNRYSGSNDSNEDTKAYNSMINDKAALTTFKRRFFKCTGITYSKNTGKVNGLSFEEVDVGEIPGY